jgi:hypothetical protein
VYTPALSAARSPLSPASKPQSASQQHKTAGLADQFFLYSHMNKDMQTSNVDNRNNKTQVILSPSPSFYTEYAASNNTLPAEEVCISIDVGSLNAGVAVFDRTANVDDRTGAFVYVKRFPLFDQHHTQVPSVTGVYFKLRDIWKEINNNPHTDRNKEKWVLIEHQPVTKDTYQKGLSFLTQLQYCIATFFLCNGVKTVQTIEPRARYRWLGINPTDDKGAKKSRWKLKKELVNNVSDSANGASILTSLTQGGGWYDEYARQAKKDDIADAMVQCLSRHYATVADFKANNMVDGNSSHTHRNSKRQKTSQPLESDPAVGQLDNLCLLLNNDDAMCGALNKFWSKYGVTKSENSLKRTLDFMLQNQDLKPVFEQIKKNRQIADPNLDHILREWLRKYWHKKYHPDTPYQ